MLFHEHNAPHKTKQNNKIAPHHIIGNVFGYPGKPHNDGSMLCMLLTIRKVMKSAQDFSSSIGAESAQDFSSRISPTYISLGRQLEVPRICLLQFRGYQFGAGTFLNCPTHLFVPNRKTWLYIWQRPINS